MKTRESYHDYQGRKMREAREETRGRKLVFKNGRKSMAVVFEPSVYTELEKYSDEKTRITGSKISKGEIVRRAVDYWLDNGAPFIKGEKV